MKKLEIQIIENYYQEVSTYLQNSNEKFTTETGTVISFKSSKEEFKKLEDLTIYQIISKKAEKDGDTLLDKLRSDYHFQKALIQIEKEFMDYLVNYNPQDELKNLLIEDFFEAQFQDFFCAKEFIDIQKAFFEKEELEKKVSTQPNKENKLKL
jgi:hypothetical protein